VRLARRHHPLLGQELEVLSASAKNFVLSLPDGSKLRVPRAWTSDAGPGGEPKGEEVVAVLADLSRLADRVVGLLGRR